MPDTFHIDLMTTNATILSAEATAAVLPAADGQIGVLSRRADMLVVLGQGRLRLELSDGPRLYDLAGGVAHMHDNRLAIVAERCTPGK